MRQFFPFAVLLCLISCAEDRHASMAFNQAESLLFTAPDSALALVRRIDGQTLSSRTLQARHALLMTIAQDKCYIDVAEDSTVRVAYDYYKKHGREWDRLMATYYLGVIQQNAKEYINAALAFREAEPLAEELEDYRQLSLIEQHLSNIFALNYDHIRALEYAKKAERAAKQAGESLMADYCRYDVAIQLLSMYRYEEAETVLKQLLDSSNENSELSSYAAKRLAQSLLFKENPNVLVAKQLYWDIEKQNKSALSSHDYGLLALISEKESDSKKADTYLQVSKSLIQSPADSAIYYNDCRNVYDERKDWEKAHRAKTESVRIQDKMTLELLEQSLTHSMESYYKNEWELEQERSRSRLYLSILIVTFLTLVFLALYSLLRKRNKQIMEDMASIQDISSDLVDSLIAEKVKSLQQLSESYFSWDDHAITKREQKRGKLSKDEIITTFRIQLSELRNDHSVIETLEQSLNLTDNGIMEKARHYLKKEKELDFSILTLLFSGFSIKSISYLLRMSEASLRMRKTRYKQQFETMSEPIRSLFLTKMR